MKLLRSILQTMSRRKLRTSLTILGVVVGMLTLTIFGAFAQRMNILVSGTVDSAASAVTIAPVGGHSLDAKTGQYLDQQTIAQIRDVAGVDRVAQIVELPLERDAGGGPPINQQTVEGIGPGADYAALAEAQSWSLSSGSGLKAGDRNAVVLGSSLATDLGKTAGDSVTIRGEKFTVAGVLNQTMSTPDSRAYMALADARRLLGKDSPLLSTTDVATSAQAYPKSGVNVDTLATRIGKTVPDLTVYSPKELKQQASSQMSLFNSIVYGIAIISLIVGALSVINTMYMSVSERTREIGIKKAVGARTSDILREYLAESAVVGLVGAVLGLLAGWGVTALVNALTASSGSMLFAVTPVLAATVLAIGLTIGAVAGIMPALKAARLDPVIALRSE
jgi:putative ABC transport system permease protein